MKKFARLFAAAALMFLATGAGAVVIPVGVVTALPGTTAALEPQLAGLVLEDETQAFSFASGAGTISGSVQSRVVRSFIDGTLDFYWRVVSDPSSSDAIGSLRLGNFFTPVYNANYRIDGLGDVAPSSAHLFPGGGGFLNFLFDGPSPFTPGNGSNFMFLDTSATNYNRSALYDLTGPTGISDAYATFAPISEPTSIAMLVLAMGALAMTRRRS